MNAKRLRNADASPHEGSIKLDAQQIEEIEAGMLAAERRILEETGSKATIQLDLSSAEYRPCIKVVLDENEFQPKSLRYPIEYGPHDLAWRYEFNSQNTFEWDDSYTERILKFIHRLKDGMAVIKKIDKLWPKHTSKQFPALRYKHAGRHIEIKWTNRARMTRRQWHEITLAPEKIVRNQMRHDRHAANQQLSPLIADILAYHGTSKTRYRNLVKDSQEPVEKTSKGDEDDDIQQFVAATVTHRMKEVRGVSAKLTMQVATPYRPAIDIGKNVRVSGERITLRKSNLPQSLIDRMVGKTVSEVIAYPPFDRYRIDKVSQGSTTGNVIIYVEPID